MIYFIRHGDFGPIKIGYTDNDIKTRLSALQVSTPEKLNLLGYIAGDQTAETILHGVFQSLNISGEWFSPDGYLIKCINDLINKKISIDDIAPMLKTTGKINLLIYENGVLVGKQKIMGWTMQAIYKLADALSLINRTTKFEEFPDLSKD